MKKAGNDIDAQRSTEQTNTHNAYYTPATLAQLWKCSTDSIYVLLRTGKLHGFKIGKDWRIPDSARVEYEVSGGVPERPAPRSRGYGKIITRVT